MSSKNLNNTTLVPIDFSKSSINALKHAAAISRIIEDDNQEITLLHVIEDTDLEIVTQDTDTSALGNKGLMIEGAKSRLKNIIDEYQSKLNNKINYIICGGKPYKKIAEIARKIHADSIVMGTHGATGWERIIGSNASRVIQISPCPVVVINEKVNQEGYNNIVLPLDLTKETKQKVTWAVKVARYYDSMIHLVSAAEDDEEWQNTIRANMKQVEKFLDKHKVKHTSEILTEMRDNFAKATIKHAEKIKSDLIIIMTQQERSLTEIFTGSYAQQIVNKSNIPVMCINPRADLEGIYSRMSPGF